MRTIPETEQILSDAERETLVSLVERAVATMHRREPQKAAERSYLQWAFEDNHSVDMALVFADWVRKTWSPS